MNKKHIYIRRICILLLVMVVMVGFAPIIPGTGDVYAVSKVKLNKTEFQGFVGQTVKLKVTGTKSKVKWSSSNRKIAKVSKKGKVTLKKAGTCMIKAKVNRKTLKCNIFAKDRENNIVFDSSVVQMDQTNYLVAQNATNERMSVMIRNDPPIDPIQVGDVVVLPPNEDYDGAMIYVERVDDYGNYIGLQGRVPDAEEILQSVDIEELAHGNLDDMQVNEDVVTSVRDATAEETNRLQANADTSFNVGKDKTLTLHKEYEDKELHTRTIIDGEVVIGAPTVTPDIEINRSGAGMEVEHFDINVDFQASADLSATIKTDLDPIYLFSIPGIELGYGFVVDVVFYLDIYGEMTASVESTFTVNAGVNYMGYGKPKVYKNCKLDATGSTELKLETLLRSDVGLSFGGYWNRELKERCLDIPLAGLYVRGGPGFDNKATIHLTKPYECDEKSIYAFVQLGLLSGNLVWDFLDYMEVKKRDWVILDNNEKNPLRWVWHYEDGKKVKTCAYENPLRYFKSVNEIGHTFGAISGRYGIHPCGATDGYRVYMCDFDSREFEFNGTKVVYEGEYYTDYDVDDDDICFGMHGEAKDMLGITEPMKVSRFEKKAGVTMKRCKGYESMNPFWPCLSYTGQKGIFTTIRISGVDHKCPVLIEDVNLNGTIQPDSRVWVEGGSKLRKK
ncbi:MAG: Ig-like domain-containing protein [Firmicutes bacterium]|nr:Ig-like domain-containing protein [Bacillota bacterium]